MTQPSYLNALKFGVWVADHTGMRCRWKGTWMFEEHQREDDCDGIHHYGLNYPHYGDVILYEYPIEIETNYGVKIGHPGDLIAQEYAHGLYEVAVKFWPGGSGPLLYDLRYVNSGYIEVDVGDIEIP